VSAEEHESARTADDRLVGHEAQLVQRGEARDDVRFPGRGDGAAPGDLERRPHGLASRRSHHLPGHVADDADIAVLEATRKSLRAAVAEGARLTKTLQKAESDGQRVAERLNLAEAQLKSTTTTPVLPAKEVARLIDGFMEEIGTGLPGLSVREGEIRLQVAFGKAGRASGFVVPSADSPPDMRKNLHEVSFRFDRTLAADPER